MGLQEQHVAFKFAGGIETKMDSKAVPAVRLLALENGVFTRAISIKKRNGYEQLSRTIDGSTSLIEDARRLATRDNELLKFTLAECYSKQSGSDQWTDAGAILAPIGYDRAAVHTGTAQTTPDRATNSGVTVYAWEDSLGGVWWTAVDALTGSIYRTPTQAHATGTRPRCVPVGDGILIFYAVLAQHEIRAVIVNPTTPTAAGTDVAVVEDLDASSGNYDAVPTGRDGTPALIAWHENATSNARVGYVTAAGVLGAPVNGNPSVYGLNGVLDATSAIAVAYKYNDGADSDRLFVSYVSPAATCDVTTVSGGDVGTTTAISPIGDDTFAGTAATRIALCAAGGSIWGAFEQNAAETSERFTIVNSMVIDSGAPDTERNIRSVGLASRAFTIGDDAFAVFVHDTVYFNTYLTLRLSDSAPAGRHLPGGACGPSRPHLPSVYVVDNVATLALAYKTRVVSENSDHFTESALRTITMDFDNEDTHQTAQFGRGLYLAAACPQHYAGRKWVEQGFHMGPELITVLAGASGNLTDNSTYEYVVWYEWTDDFGEIHRGPTSVPKVVVLAVAEDEVQLTVPTLRVTRKDNVRICVARSLPGDTATLYRVSSLDPTTEGDPNGYIANDLDVDSVTFVDRMSDANAALEEQLYTVGGILSNDAAPLGSHVAAGKNRLFFTDAQAGNVVRFSKRIDAGFGAECAPEFQHDVDPKGGDITALAYMDDVVYVFKANAILAFNGDGPYENGGNTSGGLIAGFSSSQTITEEVGCSDPSSIVFTPKGLMFKSVKGVYIITRGREVDYVGRAAELYNEQNVRRATVLPKRNAVLFLTDTGKTLYYDYEFGQWSTFTNHEGLDGAVIDDTYHYLRADSSVFRETPGAYADAGARITLRFETAWLHLLEHLQGFQRFWKLLLLGTWSSPHQLAVAHRLSYDEAWTEPYYLDATGEEEGAAGWITGDSANPIGEDPITGSGYGEGNYGEGPYGGRGPDIYQWRYGIHESGQSVQFRFEDFEKAGLAGASFELTEMTITGGVKKVDMRPFSGARST